MTPRHARLFTRRKLREDDLLLNDADFRFAADCERMRVDRNGSVLSLVLIQLTDRTSETAGAAFLSQILASRLRVTDTAGLLDDGRVGVLLPDTGPEGAWKVASDVSEVYPPGPDRPQCEVLVYPASRRAHATREDTSFLPPRAVDAPTEFFFAKPLPRWKRAFDVVGATLGLALGAPLVLTAAAAIKATSAGPAFFHQEREGLGGRRFRIWKLRTMFADAEEQKRRLLPNSHQDGPAFKMRRDPRTTKLGRFLRWSSIDEIPQFWNVLRGEMSLVGPRPLPTEESRACEGWQRRRLNVTPGITCTWQVLGRGKVRFDEWVRMDLRYAAQPSLAQDVKLVMCTIPSLIFNPGPR